MPDMMRIAIVHKNVLSARRGLLFNVPLRSRADFRQLSAALNASFSRGLRLTNKSERQAQLSSSRRVVHRMKVTRDQIKARAQELRSHKFTIRATLEMNAGARPISSPPRNAAAVSKEKEAATNETQSNHKTENLPERNVA